MSDTEPSTAEATALAALLTEVGAEDDRQYAAGSTAGLTALEAAQMGWEAAITFMAQQPEPVRYEFWVQQQRRQGAGDLEEVVWVDSYPLPHVDRKPSLLAEALEDLAPIPRLRVIRKAVFETFEVM